MHHLALLVAKVLWMYLLVPLLSLLLNTQCSKIPSLHTQPVVGRWRIMGTWNEEVSKMLILIMTRPDQDEIFLLKTGKTFYQSLISLKKTEIVWAVSQNSDYGGAHWMAEVVEIGAWRILWLLQIQDWHVCFCFTSGCRPMCDNPRRDHPAQISEGFAHNLTTQLSLKHEFVQKNGYTEV